MSFVASFLANHALHQRSSTSGRNATEGHPKKHITELNMQNSLFHQMPTEILLEIDLNLLTHSSFLPVTSGPYVAQMALRATCRRFYTSLPKPDQTVAPWNPYNRRSYSQLLRLASFRELCEQERNGKLDTLLCCTCRKTHDRGCFTVREQAKRPEERSCIGSQGVLQLCSHCRFTHAGLRRRPIDIVCNRKHHTEDDTYSGLVTIKHHIATSSKASPATVKVLTELRVLALTSAHKWTLKEGRSQVLEAVKGTYWRVCPHIHTNDVDKWLPDHFELDGKSKPTSMFIVWRKAEYTRTKTFHIQRCSAKFCCTTLTLLEEEGKDESEASRSYLLLRIERDLGSMESADDRMWMSQVMDVSELDGE